MKPGAIIGIMLMLLFIWQSFRSIEETTSQVLATMASYTGLLTVILFF